MDNYEYLLSDVKLINGIGKKTANLLKKKNIISIFDLLFEMPRSYIDRSKSYKVNELKIGKISTITVKVIKYYFPRIRNLPNRVICEDETGKIECVFFNSYIGYIKKILPLNEVVTISGKISYYRNKYQITNPSYVSTDKNLIEKVHSKYKLTEGLTEKKYNQVIDRAMLNLPDLTEWLSYKILKEFDEISWKDAITKLHDPINIGDYKSNFYKRLVFDEILACLISFSEIRKKIKKNKKKNKNITTKGFESIKTKINFNLTSDQKKTLYEINSDLKSNKKMFRLLQGDVGSGKTIVSLIASLEVILDKYQVAFMAPTEILARQHFNLAKKIFPDWVKISYISGKTKNTDRKNIINGLSNNSINLVIGTHALFQQKIKFARLGLIIIDEQHKFGVKQRKNLSDKGGSECDVLVMTATPIPRSLIMSIYGDMDLSVIKEKPKNREEVKTYSKPENKTADVLNFIKKEIKKKNQIFWVCPLIEESKKIDHQSAIQKYNFLKKIFQNKVGLLHGNIDNIEKEKILLKFLNQDIDILVSTTVIEVGIDFPNATTIVIENANKFGLSQLHQLRGRVGRGKKKSNCILMFKSNLSENAKKRIKILKSTNDGFKISEEDMKLRGFGDILGFKQSGTKNFKLADPIINEDLFLMAEKEIKRIEFNEKNFSRYKVLLKLYDKADIINDVV